jgi:dipeptidyl aminopeptidase/acylaminoacyl peptidase
VLFALGCTPPLPEPTTGIDIVVLGTGEDLDATFRVLVDGREWGSLLLNQRERITGLSAGSHVLTLASVESNCAVEAPTPRSVVVTAGTMVPVTLSITCSRVWELAFFRSGHLTLTSTDGSITKALAERPLFFTNQESPSWSPDGSRLAYSCGGICIARFDGRPHERFDLPDLSVESFPAWRPDGRAIAFVRWVPDESYISAPTFDGLFLMNADGSSPSRIPLPAEIVVFRIAWSPDGTRLALECQSAQAGICLINADGSNPRSHIAGFNGDGGPAWSPDGTRIAFHTSRYGPGREIALIDPDGAGVTRLSPGTLGVNPAWSPDGRRLVFAGQAANGGTVSTGLYAMDADGTGLTRLTTGPDDAPAWRPPSPRSSWDYTRGPANRRVAATTHHEPLVARSAARP